MKNKLTTKLEFRKRRHSRVRAKVSGTLTRPRLTVHKSNRFISAQIIDDTSGKTLAECHGREFKGSQSLQALKVGEAIAKKALSKKVAEIVFDRGGYRYGGQIKTLADAARQSGLKF